MGYLDDLNKTQYEAVTTTEGYLRVVAGAGSGKTRVLTSRYVYLVKEVGIEPKNILSLTFTNKAAGEMKERIKRELGEEFDSSLISTYHGFCARLLRKESNKVLYPKTFMIIDEAEQKEILASIYEKYELRMDNQTFEFMKDYIGSHKYDTKYVKPLFEGTFKVHEEDSLEDKIMKEYLIKERELYGLDFDDLIMFTVYILENHKDIRDYYQDKLNYIMVDEFQDTSSDEYRLLELLSSKHKNLMIVGDPDQNIYEWRGSKNEFLVDFDKTHKGCKTIILDMNYRSTPEILTCANSLIDKNVKRIKKELKTENYHGLKVTYTHNRSDKEEANQIIDKIKKTYDGINYKYKDFAILYRSSYLSQVIEETLNENFLPYRILGGVRFYERLEIVDALSFLRLVCYYDDYSFKRIINKPRRKFGKIKLQRLMSLDGSDTLFKKLERNLDSSFFKGADVREFIDLINKLHLLKETESAYDIAIKVLEGSGYEEYIQSLGDMERLNNLSAFKRIVFDYCVNNDESKSLDEFLNHIALDYPEEKKDGDDILLMTCHSSKGLEFKNVFLIGVNEGIFPSPKTVEERGDDGMEEERRLMYVAMTRARETLCISECDGMCYSKEGVRKPSRFIREIGFNNMTLIGVPDDILYTADFKETVGDKKIIVNHKLFGRGIVVGKVGDSLKIKFDNYETERVISKNFVEIIDDGENPDFFA